VRIAPICTKVALPGVEAYLERWLPGQLRSAMLALLRNKSRRPDFRYIGS